MFTILSVAADGMKSEILLSLAHLSGLNIIYKWEVHEYYTSFNHWICFYFFFLFYSISCLLCFFIHINKFNASMLLFVWFSIQLLIFRNTRVMLLARNFSEFYYFAHTDKMEAPPSCRLMSKNKQIFKSLQNTIKIVINQKLILNINEIERENWH